VQNRKKENLLDAVTREKLLKKKQPSDFEKSVFKNMTCVQNAGSSLSVFGVDNKPSPRISNDHGFSPELLAMAEVARREDTCDDGL
jgi:hypothetical protein